MPDLDRLERELGKGWRKAYRFILVGSQFNERMWLIHWCPRWL